MTALGRAWRPALLLAGLLGAGLAVRSGVGRDALDAPAQAGPLAFMAFAAVACAIGVPRQLTAYAAGLGFGLPGGCALALSAQLLGCAIDFAWARWSGRAWVARRINGRIARLEAALTRQPFTATLTLRLLPLGSNVALNLLAGVSAMAPAPFLAASAVGFLPQTVVFGLLGAGVRVGQGAQLALAVALFAACSALGLTLLRRAPGHLIPARRPACGSCAGGVSAARTRSRAEARRG